MRGGSGMRPLGRLALRRAGRRPELPVVLLLLVTLAAAVLGGVALAGDRMLGAGVRSAVAAGDPAERGIQVSAQFDPANQAEQDGTVTAALRRVLGDTAAAGVTRQLRSDLLPVSGLRPSPSGQLRLVAEMVPDAAAHARLTAGSWPSAAGSGSELDVALQADAAARLGITVGGSIPLTSAGPGSPALHARVLGLWRADRSDPFWLGDPLETTGQERATVLGPMLLAGDTRDPPAAGGGWIVRWRSWVAPDRVGVDTLTRVTSALGLLPGLISDLPTGGGTSPTIDDGLTPLLAGPASVLPGARAAVLALVLLLAVLAVLLAGLGAALLTESRYPEVLILRARGASGGQRRRLVIGEVVALVVVAVLPAAVLLRLTLGWLVSEVPGQPGPGVGAVLLAAAAGALVIGAVLVLAALLAERRRAASTTRGGWEVDAAVLAAALLASWQLWARSTGRLAVRVDPAQDPVLAASPAIALLGAAMLLVRLGRRLADRSGGAPPAAPVTAVLAIWSAARRGARPAIPAVGLLLAAATSVVLLTGWRTVGTTLTDRSAAELGADLVLDVPAAGGDPTGVRPLTGRLADLPGVRAASPVLRQQVRVGDQVGTLLAVDTRTIAAVTAGDARWAVPASALTGLRAGPVGLGVTLPAGRTIDLQLKAATVAGTDPFSGLRGPPGNGTGAVQVLAWLADPGGVLTALDLGSVPVDGPERILHTPLPASSGLRLAAVDLTVTASPRYPGRSVQVDVRSLGTSGGGSSSAISGQAWNVQWVGGGQPASPGVPVSDPQPGLLLHLHVPAPPPFGSNLQTVRVAPDLGSPSTSLAMLLSRDLADRLGVRGGAQITVDINDQPVPVRVAAVVDRLPGGRPPNVPEAFAPDAPDAPVALVDLSALTAAQLNDGAAIPPEVAQWWLAAGPGANSTGAATIATAAPSGTTASGAPNGAAASSAEGAVQRGGPVDGLLRVGGNGAAVRSLHRLAEVRIADPIPAGLRRLLLLGTLTAVAVGAVTLALGQAVSAGARRGELATLRALGMTTAELRRVLLLEQVLVAGPAIAVGVLLGWLIGRFAAWTLTGFSAAGAPLPAVPWPAVLLAIGSLLIVVLGGAVLGSRTAARLDVPSALREASR